MENRKARAESAIRAGDVTPAGWLEIPENAAGVVVLAHGSGSSRYSRRNNAVADYLRTAGLGTLLFDLLTTGEGRVDEVTREFRFDIGLLARRLGGAGDELPRVQAPTLLIVGGADLQVLELNRHARERMRCPAEIALVEGATHLFEEPGALEEVQRLARDWFLERFAQTQD